jgi:predicted Zn-dependent protease
MIRRSRWTTLILGAAAAACGDIATPIRNDFYEWRLIVPSATASVEDSLTFHWPKSRLPVRFWVEDAASLPQNVPGGIAAWRKAFLYGEFDATIVSDSSTADVIVRAGAAPGVKFDRARLHSALAPECSGATDLDISPDHRQLRLPIRVYVDPHSDPAAPGLSECLALTTTHELGHTLGIWRHSAVATDLMYVDPAVAAPSERDLATAEVLYHLTPNVEIVGPVPTQ